MKFVLIIEPFNNVASILLEQTLTLYVPGNRTFVHAPIDQLANMEDVDGYVFLLTADRSDNDTIKVIRELHTKIKDQQKMLIVIVPNDRNHYHDLPRETFPYVIELVHFTGEPQCSDNGVDNQCASRDLSEVCSMIAEMINQYRIAAIA